MSDTLTVTPSVDNINPLDYGVLTTGFSRMRMPEIRQAIIDTLQARTGLTFETRPDSITGQFIDTFAEREAYLWELCEAVYLAMYPISAFGISLDYAVSFAGVTRLFAQPSTAWCACYGAETTLIAAGAIIRNGVTQESYTLQTDVTIGRSAAVDLLLTVTTAVTGQDYWVSVDGVAYHVTATGLDSQTTIANRLRLALTASGLQVTSDAANLRLYTVTEVPFNAQFSSNIALLSVGSKGEFTASEFGPKSVLPGELNTIVTTQTGWTAVNNIVQGQQGRDLETDDELRLRYQLGVYRLGGSQQESIKQNITQNVRGITYLEVYENETNAVDSESRLPHSIEVVAVGGDPTAIARELFRVKAAGIDTNGAILVQVPDSSGQQNPIRFNRPSPVYIWVQATVTLYNEETFPDTGSERMVDIIVATGNSFGIGKDVITQRFHGPIYRGINGIGSLDIKVARGTDPTTPPGAGAYSSANLAIASRELSQFDPVRTSVILP